MMNTSTAAKIIQVDRVPFLGSPEVHQGGLAVFGASAEQRR